MKIYSFLALCFALPLFAGSVICIDDAVQAEFSGNEKIIFTRHSTGKAALYDLKSRKTTEFDFTGNSFSSLHNGKVFFCGDGIFPQLFILDTADGKTKEIATSDAPSGTIFKVSPDVWAFPCGYDKVPKLLFVNEKTLQELTPRKLPAGTVSVSSDGKYAAVQFDNGTCNIKVVEIATCKTIFTTNTVSGSMQKNGCHSPVFSPDSKKLLYVSGDIQPLADIMLYDLEKSELIRLTTDGKDNQRPRWSADGKRYCHSTLRNGKYCTVIKEL